MLKYKKELGIIIGFIIALVLMTIELNGLSKNGQLCLALSMMTVTFWVFKVAHPGFVSGFFLMLLVILNVAPPAEIFALWESSLIYMVIGAYLIAGAVENSGLGERIAYYFIIKYVSGYKSIIYSIFALTFILAILIPHPWPRAFLIMSVMKTIIDSTSISDNDASKIGFTVFAASVPISRIFLTADSTVNIMAVEFSGVNISWFDWLIRMGVPAILASILTLILILILFKPEKNISIDKNIIQKKLDNLGKLSTREIRVIIWMTIAVILWLTDSIHGIELGWITLLISMIMSFPIIGEVIDIHEWRKVPMPILLFLTAAVAIGKIGGLTGMNNWIANLILPESVPVNIYLLAIMISVISILLHMTLGSVITVMGLAIPAFMVFTEGSGVSPFLPALIVYTSASLHYILPFHHLSILVGVGEENGGFTDKHTIKIGIPLTFIVLIVVIFEIFWWQLLGIV